MTLSYNSNVLSFVNKTSTVQGKSKFNVIQPKSLFPLGIVSASIIFNACKADDFQNRYLENIKVRV